MKILSVECSATPASCAIIDDGKIVASSFINTKLTHSQTLMQMIINTLDNSATKLGDIDKIAIAVGPGSFTGLRIGISAVKGLAAPSNIPCLPVSTLEGMAEQFVNQDSIICAVMDARCNQFYNALFEVKDGNITRLCEDRAISIADLETELKANDKPFTLCGDGFAVCEKNFQDVEFQIADEQVRFPQGVAVCTLAIKYINEAKSPDKISPAYLRLPQASRELLKKKEK